jgi:IMP dehydrogenase
MKVKLGKNKEVRYTFGFDEVSLVPGDITIDPEEVDISWKLDSLEFPIPIIASAMDGVVDVNFAKELGKLGGLAVLNLEGIYTRYENPEVALNKIIDSPQEEVINVIQNIYKEPIKENLISKRIKEMKKHNIIVAVSSTPAKAEKFAIISQDAGADIFVVQSTVTTVEYISSKNISLSFEKFLKKISIPVIVGNCVSYSAAKKLFSLGISGVLVGVGPGAACTTRRVLGVGVPQMTAISDVTSAREEYYKKTKKYISVIADGGMRVGGDIAKAIAAGADAVMLGSLLASAKESAGKGYHWGMATSDKNLPRGTRVKVGIKGTLKEILFGPAKSDDGSMNLIGALRQSLGICGARNIKEMHKKVEIVVAPSINTEGKDLQIQQRVGMGK